MSRFLNTPAQSQWAGAGGGAAARRAAKQRVSAAAAGSGASGGRGDLAASLRAFAAEGSARSAASAGGGSGVGAPFSAAGMTKSQKNKARLKRRKQEERSGGGGGGGGGGGDGKKKIGRGGGGGGNVGGGAHSAAKHNTQIRNLAESRDVSSAFRHLEALLRKRLPLHDTTVAMLITLCLRVARQPERIDELTQAMRYSGTPLDVHSLLTGLGSVSQLCAAGTDAPAEESVAAIVKALFGDSGLAQLVQLPLPASDAARQHVLHHSKLLVMEFLGGAVGEFDRIANKPLNDLVRRHQAVGPGLVLEHISPDGTSVSVRVQPGASPFNKGDAVLLSGTQSDPSDPELEQIEQIEGAVANAGPLRLTLREPIPQTWTVGGPIVSWRVDKLGTRLAYERSINALKKMMLSLAPKKGEQTAKHGADTELMSLIHYPSEALARTNIWGAFDGAMVEAEATARGCNISQAKAVAHAVRRRLTLVHGPPGTGKTRTAVEIIRMWVRERRTPVLVCADSNIAVDNLCLSCLEKGGLPHSAVVRNECWLCHMPSSACIH